MTTNVFMTLYTALILAIGAAGQFHWDDIKLAAGLAMGFLLIMRFAHGIKDSLDREKRRP